MKNLFFIFLFIGFTSLALTPSVFCQKLGEGIYQKQGDFKVSKDATITYDYIEVLDTSAFRKLTARMRPENFPINIIKKPVFDPIVDLMVQYDSQLDEYVQLEKHYMTLDSINALKIAELVKLNDIQNKRVDNYKQMSEDLRVSNKDLNEQLTGALKIAKDCNNGKVRRQIWTGVLGGAVGFTVGALITLLVK